MEIVCDDYVKTHPYRFCRDACSEEAIDRESYNSCVEECVKEVERKCY
ncbi:hypothetical protein QPL79_02450 [Ignisphaera sp. 4213-co]|uniref:Four-helix bundle copper-binding protein n=1 Tax=Ignisphaera cupida TaxID=3050454 RepID=A0ABD4Z4H4_9CREN|nr:hypothetical protein [Ignisphaera sp. 4213-co]MDK6028226.1 hypothetical protein [Ignisphaera sp. 4213-co]